MTTFPPIIDDERDNLLGYLGLQRGTFAYIAHGLSDEQARSQPTAGTLSIAGLIKHVTQTERGWVATILGLPLPEADYANGFTMRQDETLEGLLADLERCGQETPAALEPLPLNHPVSVRKDPRFPKDLESRPLRWVLGHLIQELARHAGHGDIIREAIDGRSMYELRAMTEGWHAEFLKTQQRYTQ